ncbi:sodium:proton antiporter [Actinocorallia longicatena]|uniref:Sodium:proton antiporter n=1 Tax=Actinocorallia longicatena TaxID=111803 RepID=A0ABP6PWM3_9ACTN
MELPLIAVAGVIAIVAVAVLSRRIGVAAPLGLVVVGAALGFTPGLPPVEVDPDWVLTVVLPPLLYGAAVHMPAIDFRRDFKMIASLAVLLVVVTTLVSGWMFNAVIGGLGLAGAFALGAIISPTDAVAATSVGRRLGLPSRLMTILEGEGLVNDASSLVLLSSAIAAMTQTVHVWRIGLDFLWAVAAAIAVGLAIGALSVRVRARLNDTVLTTAISFVVPFVAFLPAEELGASGVLAVVVTGLVTGHMSPRHLRARDRIAETVNWTTVAFLLESAIFLLMGLQLHTLLDQAGNSDLGTAKAVGIGLLASLLVVVLRMLFVAPLVSSIGHDAERADELASRLSRMRERLGDPVRNGNERHRERMEQRISQRESDIAFVVAENFGWRGGVVLAWSGMRGAVTVAAAQTLPAGTPHRPQVQLIAFVVAVTTLLAQGLTLPRVIRAVKVPGDDTGADRAEYQELLRRLGAVAGEILDGPSTGERFDPAVVERVREDTAASVPPEGEERPPPDADLREQYLTLVLEVLGAEQIELLSVRDLGLYSSRTLTFAQDVLDRELARFQQGPDT